MSLCLTNTDRMSPQKALDIRMKAYKSKASTNPRFKELIAEATKISITYELATSSLIVARSSLQQMSEIFAKSQTSLALASKASKSSSSKPITIVCVKGKSTLKITGLKPLCPPGYKKIMTELLWYCPNCKSGNDRLEAVLGRKKYWFFGERKRKLIAICIDCWHEMEFVGTV